MQCDLRTCQQRYPRIVTDQDLWRPITPDRLRLATLRSPMPSVPAKTSPCLEQLCTPSPRRGREPGFALENPLVYYYLAR